MALDKVMETLGVEKLDESKQAEISEALKQMIQEKAEILATEKVQDKEDELKENVKNDLVEKFEEYKSDVASKFSNFVDSVLEEEMVIPESVMKFARQGQLYGDLVEQFKLRLAIDEGMLTEEVKDMLREAKEEIISLQEQLNSVIAEKLELEKDAKEMAHHIYLRKKCDGLTEAKRTRVLKLLEGIESKEEIDRKFSYIIEADDEEKEDVKEYECPKCGTTANVKDGDDTTCPECGTKMKLAGESEGKGETEPEDKEANEDKLMKEDSSPFMTAHKAWMKVLRENRV